MSLWFGSNHSRSMRLSQLLHRIVDCKSRRLSGDLKQNSAWHSVIDGVKNPFSLLLLTAAVAQREWVIEQSCQLSITKFLDQARAGSLYELSALDLLDF